MGKCTIVTELEGHPVNHQANWKSPEHLSGIAFASFVKGFYSVCLLLGQGNVINSAVDMLPLDRSYTNPSWGSVRLKKGFTKKTFVSLSARAQLLHVPYLQYNVSTFADQGKRVADYSFISIQ